MEHKNTGRVKKNLCLTVIYCLRLLSDPGHGGRRILVRKILMVNVIVGMNRHWSDAQASSVHLLIECACDVGVVGRRKWLPMHRSDGLHCAHCSTNSCRASSHGHGGHTC